MTTVDLNRDTFRTNGRPIAQWSRLDAGRSDDLERPPLPPA